MLLYFISSSLSRRVQTSDPPTIMIFAWTGCFCWFESRRGYDRSLIFWWCWLLWVCWGFGQWAHSKLDSMIIMIETDVNTIWLLCRGAPSTYLSGWVKVKDCLISLFLLLCVSCALNRLRIYKALNWVVILMSSTFGGRHIRGL